MSHRRSDALAKACCDSLVVLADPLARGASISYWEYNRPAAERVKSRAMTLDVAHLRELAGALLSRPDDASTYYGLRDALSESLRDRTHSGVLELADLGWEADRTSRIGYQVGRHYVNGAYAGAAQADLSLEGRHPAPGASASARVQVVVPFRDRSMQGARSRNLLACLRALNDQSMPRSSYSVAVVETDVEPRVRGAVSGLVDSYLFARNPGKFNKSWALNVGVVHGPPELDLVCLLDCDVLPDRHFISRNATRAAQAVVGGHVPYLDMLCLDPRSTLQAITRRLVLGGADARADELRAFVVRRPPGCCVWVRRSAFMLIGGMDERYEGWGGEDNDFFYRLDRRCGVDRFNDKLWHMYHPSAGELDKDGNIVNSHIPAMTWSSTEDLGCITKFATATPSVAANAGALTASEQERHRQSHECVRG